MGIFSRLRRGVKSKANAAIDKMVDPEKELDMAIVELEEQKKKALQELLSYKSTAKQMEQDMAAHQQRADDWEKRAMEAVKAGNDALAKDALRKHKEELTQVQNIRRDRDEAAGYAIELNRSRKRAETKLQTLKLKKGTLATQIALARGGDNPFSTENELWDKLERAEEKIDSEAIEAEVDAAMKGEELATDTPQLSDADVESRLLEAGHSDADSALAELKSKMAAEADNKKLTS